MKRIPTMKNAVILTVLLFMMGMVPSTGSQVSAAAQGLPLFAQNEYSQEGEGGERETYSENEGEYDQDQQGEYEDAPGQEDGGQYYEEQPDQNEPEPYQGSDDQYRDEHSESSESEPGAENEGEYDQEQQDQYEQEQDQEIDNQYNEEQPEPVEPVPGSEDGGLIDREQPDKDEPGSGGDLEQRLQEDVPALGDTPPDAALSGGSSSMQASSGQCSKAAGKVIILLGSAGIQSGTTYIKSEGKVIFSNTANVTHPVTASPSGILSSDSFRITPHSKVFMFAGSTTQTRHGTVKVNAGKSNQTVHDVIICP
jgi:hypothetical protein